VPDANVIYLITIYNEDQNDDLSGEERRLYRQLVQLVKQRAEQSEGA
jgi:hypothetical protein